MNNFDLKKYLVENKVTSNFRMLKEYSNKPSEEQVSDYWSIMVDNQPADVKRILTDLTTGKMPYNIFVTSTIDDIYDSFRDEFEVD